jgi:branched-chain amino acid transport system substrate-binding protein
MLFNRSNSPNRGSSIGLLILLMLLLAIGGCTRPLGPVGADRIEPLGPVAPQAPVPEVDIEPEPGIILTAEAAAAGDFIVGVGVIRQVGDHETLYGDSLEQGLRLAVDQINNLDYMGAGRRMAIMFGESAVVGEAVTDPLVPQAALENIVAAIGPVLRRGEADAPEDVAVPLVLLPTADEGLFNDDVYVDNWIFHPGNQGLSLTIDALLTARDRLGVNQVGVVYPTDALVDVQVLLDVLQAEGIEIVATPSFDEGIPLPDLLARLRDANPDAVVLYVPEVMAVEIIALVQEMEFPAETRFILGRGLFQPELLATAGDAATGLIGAVPWYMVEAPIESEEFAEAYQQTFAVDADPVAAKAYTAIWMLAEAIRSANTTDPAALREALATIQQIDTPFGQFAFPDAQAQLRTPVLLEVREEGEVAILME